MNTESGLVLSRGFRARRRARTIPKEEIRPAELLVKGKKRLKLNPETKKGQQSQTGAAAKSYAKNGDVDNYKLMCWRDGQGGGKGKGGQVVRAVQADDFLDLVSAEQGGRGLSEGGLLYRLEGGKSEQGPTTNVDEDEDERIGFKKPRLQPAGSARADADAV